MNTRENQKIYVGKIFRRLLLFLVMVLGITFLLPETQIYALAADNSYKTVKVGYYQAKGFQEGDGKNSPRSGYAYEYMQKVSSYTGWNYEYVSGDWEELYAKLERGEIDVLAGVSLSEDREGKILYPQYEMLDETFYIYVDCQHSTIKSGDMDSYKGKRIGVVDDAKMKPCLEKWKEETGAEITIVTYTDLATCGKDFNEGKIDGFVSADNIVSSYSGISPVEKIGKLPYYFCVSAQRSDLLNELNMALSAMNSQDSLELDILRNKYRADSSVNVFLSRQEQDWMQAHPQITVGYMKNYMPYCDMDKDGEVTGFIKDLVPDLFAALPGHYEPKIHYQCFDDHEQMMQALKNGEVDFVFPVGGEKNYAEDQGYQQSSIILTTATDLVYKGDYSEKTLSKIAVNKNNQLQYNYTKAHYPDAKIIEYNNIDACIQSVKQGTATCTIMDALRAVKQTGEDSELILLPLTEGREICFGVNFGDSDLLWLLNHGISALGDEYGITHVYKYSGYLVTYTAGDFIREHREYLYGGIAVVLLLIIALFAVRYHSLRRREQVEKEHSQALKEALDKAQEANRAKQTFLNNISHDIRTPLNGIIGIIEMNQKTTDEELIRKNQKKAHKQAEQLLCLVNNVIELSNLESGLVESKPEEMDLKALTDLLVEEKAIKARLGGISLHRESVDSKKDWPVVIGDYQQIREILTHIVDNAIQYNVSGGKVIWKDELVWISSQQVQYNCVIEDTGVGMKPEFMGHIFEEFVQEQNSARTIYRGAGLGMPIVKRLLEQMNGTIDIESEAGKGTIVRIAIPFVTVQRKISENNLGNQTNTNLKNLSGSLSPVLEKNDDKMQYKDQAGENNDTEPGKLLAGMQILLVEDNELNIEVAKFLLEDAGAEVIVAKDGVQGVKTYEQSPEYRFQAILMDIMMPHMDGYEATRAIRSLDRADAQSIPIIALTACVSDDAREKSADAGMNAFLEKPLDLQAMIELLHIYR